VSGQGKARYAFESHTHSGLGTGTGGTGGTIIYSGAGSPSSSVGVAGDFYVDTTNKIFWGPKGSSWTTSFSLNGSPGATGATGPQGPAGSSSSGSSYAFPNKLLVDWFKVLDPALGNPLDTTATKPSISSQGSGVSTILMDDTLIYGSPCAKWIFTSASGVCELGAFPSGTEQAGTSPSLVSFIADSTTVDVIYVRAYHSFGASVNARLHIYDITGSTNYYTPSVSMASATWTDFSYTLASSLNGHRLVPSLQLTVSSGTTGIAKVSSFFGAKTVTIADTTTADYVKQSFGSQSQLVTSVSQGGIGPDTNSVATTYTSTGLGDFFTIQKSGRYLFNIAYGLTVYLQSVGSIYNRPDTEFHEVEITFHVGSAGSPASLVLSESIYCPHTADGHCLQVYATDRWFYRRLIYSQTVGWICTDHLDDIPPVVKKFPTVVSGTSTPTYLNGTAVRYARRDRDIDLYTQDLTTYIPSNIRQKTFNYGTQVALGPSHVDTVGGGSPQIGNLGAAYVYPATDLSGKQAVTVVLRPYVFSQYANHKYKGGSAYEAVHEYGHVVDQTWIIANGLSSTGSLIASGTTYSTLKDHPDMVALYAAVFADPNMDHTLYAYTGGLTEWWAECCASKWMNIPYERVRNMGGRTISAASYVSNTSTGITTVTTTFAHGLTTGALVSGLTVPANDIGTRENLANAAAVTVTSGTTFTFAYGGNTVLASSCQFAVGDIAHARVTTFDNYLTANGVF
jgi:hypothetical protein